MLPDDDGDDETVALLLIDPDADADDDMLELSDIVDVSLAVGDREADSDGGSSLVLGLADAIENVCEGDTDADPEHDAEILGDYDPVEDELADSDGDRLDDALEESEFVADWVCEAERD